MGLRAVGAVESGGGEGQRASLPFGATVMEQRRRLPRVTAVRGIGYVKAAANVT